MDFSSNNKEERLIENKFKPLVSRDLKGHTYLNKSAAESCMFV